MAVVDELQRMQAAQPARALPRSCWSRRTAATPRRSRAQSVRSDARAGRAVLAAFVGGRCPCGSRRNVDHAGPLAGSR